MLTITKRSGKEQPFDPKKIINTLSIVSEEVHQPLGPSELNSILQDISAILEEKTTATSRQIYMILIGVLYDHGYHELLKPYTEYHNSKMR